jgi:hypothetical protein
MVIESMSVMNIALFVGCLSTVTLMLPHHVYALRSPMKSSVDKEPADAFKSTL